MNQTVYDYERNGKHWIVNKFKILFIDAGIKA